MGGKIWHEEKYRTARRAPGDNVLPDQFQTVAAVLPSNWAEKHKSCLAPNAVRAFLRSRVAIFRYFFFSSKFSGVRSFANWMAYFLLFLTAAFHSLDMKHTSLSQSRPPCLHNLSGQLFKVDWFSVRTLVNFTHVNKIEAMYERPRVTVSSEVQLLRLCLAFHIAYTWHWKSTFSLKMLNVDHSIVNGDV